MVVPLPAAPVRAVLFGKLPSHGDFVSRGLEPAETDRWDALLADGLGQAQAALGEAFDDAHGSAPPWRFVARADAGGWRVGVLAPSVDSAGRRFVLLLAAEGLDDCEAASLGPTLAERLEGALYDALTEGLTADQTHARAREAVDLAAISVPAALLRSEPRQSVWWTLGGVAHASDATVADLPTPAVFIRMLTPVAGSALSAQEAAA